MFWSLKLKQVEKQTKSYSNSYFRNPRSKSSRKGLL